MKQRNVFSVLGVASAIALTGTQASAEQVPGEYLVKYKGSAVVSIASLKSVPMVRLMDHNPKGNLVKVKVKPETEAQALARIMKDPNVEYVVPNAKLYAFRAPVSVEAMKEQWSLSKVRAEEAWNRAGSRGSKNVVIAVIDTGVDYNHPSLRPNMVAGYDFKENDSDPMDKTSQQNPGHGTHCAGIMGATGLVDGGVLGMSPVVSIMPIRFLGEDGSGDLNAAIKSVDYAIEKKVQVVSASWGATIPRAQAGPLIEAIKRVDDAGIIFVSAAANDGKNNDNTDVFPANAGFPNSITVAASGPNDEKPQWSNYGKRTVHVAAPGLDIMSTLPNNGYNKLSGTSMATPLVSGLVALLKSIDPALTGAQTRALLQLTGAKAEIETACNCRVDAMSAVDTLMSKKMFVFPAAATIAKGETLQFGAYNGEAPFTFESANTATGTINEQGLFTAVADGETTVTVKDAKGQVSTSLAIRVGGTGGGGGGGGQCPFQDPALCQILCQVQPDLPFCN